jgi:abhydrolase domain-containing protein 5
MFARALRGIGSSIQLTSSLSTLSWRLHAWQQHSLTLRQSGFGAGAVAAAAAAVGWGVGEGPPTEAAEACDKLLRMHVRTAFKTYTLEGLYTVELEAPFPGAPVLVLLSGYASGSGLWASCLDQLASRYQVIAVDWLGTGCSERPPFRETTTAGAEGFFLRSLESWRAHRLGPAARVTLVGHSLGGYLAAAYALGHPQAVEHLVLVNPAGVPALANQRMEEARAKYWVVGALGRAWEGGVTPGSLIRALGPLGKGAVESVVTRRFSRLPSPPTPELSDYIHKIMAARGSGEFALPLLLEFGALAKHPVGPRMLQGAWRGPTTIIHGQHDWMPVLESERLAGDLKRLLGMDAFFAIIPGTEHYVFMEAPEKFCWVLMERGDSVLGKAQRAPVI